MSNEIVRRVFITGGAHGIGRGMVEAFASQGHRVAFCDVDDRAGQDVAQLAGAQFFPLDVCNVADLEECLQSLFSEWGDLDIIVNNVGISHFCSILDTTIDDFDRVLATNLRPVFVTARAWARHRDSQYGSSKQPCPYGRMINICSTRHLQSEVGTEAYSASKGGIRSLTHALAMSLSPYGITVNCLSPGWINVSDETIRPIDAQFHPSGRVGTVDDISRAALYLCQEGNDFVNGQNITIDGGATIQMIYPE